MEDSVAIGLGHAGMDEEAGIAKLVNFLSKEFNSLSGVAENDCLGNVQLAEESVETVELLSLFQEGVVLSQTFQSELVGNANKNWIGYVGLHKIFDLNWVSRTEHHNLSIVVHHGKNVLDVYFEVHAQQFVDLVKYQQIAVVKICYLLACKVEDAARCRYDHVHGLCKTVEVLPNEGATC